MSKALDFPAGSALACLRRVRLDLRSAHSYDYGRSLQTSAGTRLADGHHSILLVRNPG